VAQADWNAYVISLLVTRGIQPWSQDAKATPIICNKILYLQLLIVGSIIVVITLWSGRRRLLWLSTSRCWTTKGQLTFWWRLAVNLWFFN
jgi:hypothetical protein